MFAYASYHRRGVVTSRNKPLILFPCLEMVPSACNLLMAVSGRISIPSLSLIMKLGKLLPFPLRDAVSCRLLHTYPSLSPALAVCGTHYRPTLGSTEAP